MTVLCGGGSSGPKLGTAAVVDYSAGLLAVLLENLGVPWLVPAIPLAGLAPLVLSTFCSTDPPAMPSFTQAEANALLQLTLGTDFASALPKLVALIENVIWNDACHCTSGTYTPAAAPSQPAGSVTIILPGPTPAVPCVSAPQHGLTVCTGNVFSFTLPIDFAGYAATGAQFTTVLSNSTGGGASLACKVVWYGPDHTTVLRNDVFNIPAGNGSYTFNFTPAPGATYGNVQATAGGTGCVDHLSNWSIYCNGNAPGTNVTPCCPPDPATAATLLHILDLVLAIQRNYAPFAYVKGAVHSGLTGLGSVPVSRLLGVEVQITAYPPSNQVLPGNPSYIKDLGWMSVSETDGMIQELRPARAQFTWFPQLMPIADHVNYNFFPGVTATITELQPEP